jgi:hypothetical protein
MEEQTRGRLILRVPGRAQLDMEIPLTEGEVEDIADAVRREKLREAARSAPRRDPLVVDLFDGEG